MTKDELLAVAQKLAQQQHVVHMLSVSNRPKELKDMVEADARLMVERGILAKLESQYANALSQYTRAALT